ncbi:MAG: hypothetical protein KGQ52_11130 [Alphaproteobacteria bacterium]|nr:hypothetical protein [Alphaproteobacteria bacterium]
MRITAGALGALFLATAAMAQPAALPSADEIVQKNLAARGGQAALAALTSLTLDGKLVFPGGFELTYHEVRSGGAVRVEATLQGLTLVQAYDGKGGGWRINPFEGRKDAEKMGDDEARSLADAATIPGVLLSARADGASVSLLGREDFDGTDCYKLKVIQKDGDEFIYLIDPDSMLEVKIVETRKLRGAVQVSETELGDYEAVAGVMFPMSVESGPQGASQRQRTIITKAAANAAAPPALFAQPAK